MKLGHPLHARIYSIIGVKIHIKVYDAVNVQYIKVLVNRTVASYPLLSGRFTNLDYIYDNRKKH